MNDRHPRFRARDRVICWLGLVLGLSCPLVGAGHASQPPFEVGQQWRYQHTGPRPGSIEPNAIDGERILWIVSTVAEQGGTRWVVEERFTNDQKVIGRLFVDQAGLLTAVEVENEKGEAIRLRYDPPIPYQPADMNVGEIRTFPTTLRADSASFSLPLTTVVERLADETVVTPAGEFPGCAHFKSTTKSVVDLKIAKVSTTEERERWYHPSVQGMVKEVYRKGPVKFLSWSRAGYTATSTLTAYRTEAVPPARTPTQPGIVNASGQTATHPAGGAAGRWGRLVLLTVVLVVVVLGCAAWRRKTGRRRTI